MLHFNTKQTENMLNVKPQVGSFELARISGYDWNSRHKRKS